MDSEMKTDAVTGVVGELFPKMIAEIKICGALTIQIRDGADFIPPTEEQRKNLKEMLCIDVEIFE